MVDPRNIVSQASRHVQPHATHPVRLLLDLPAGLLALLESAASHALSRSVPTAVQALIRRPVSCVACPTHEHCLHVLVPCAVASVAIGDAGAIRLCCLGGDGAGSMNSKTAVFSRPGTAKGSRKASYYQHKAHCRHPAIHPVCALVSDNVNTFINTRTMHGTRSAR
jgi:hypothetical protein